MPENCSFAVNYLVYVGWRSADFLQGVLSPKIFDNILFVVVANTFQIQPFH
jgi:hypothetical protein